MTNSFIVRSATPLTPVEPAAEDLHKPEVRPAAMPHPEPQKAVEKSQPVVPQEPRRTPDVVLTSPMTYKVSAPEAIEKGTALMELIKDSRPDLAPEVDAIVEQLDALDSRASGIQKPEDQSAAPAGDTALSPAGDKGQITEGDKVKVSTEEGENEGTAVRQNSDSTWEVSTADGMMLSKVPAESLELIPRARETMTLPSTQAGKRAKPKITAAKPPKPGDPQVFQNDDDVLKALKAAGVGLYRSGNNVVPEVNVKVGVIYGRTPKTDTLIKKYKVPEGLQDELRQHAFETMQENWWRIWFEDNERISEIFGRGTKVDSVGRSGGHLIVDVDPVQAFAEEQDNGSFKLNEAKVQSWLKLSQEIKDSVKPENIDGNMASQLEIDFELGQFSGELREWWDETYKGYAETMEKELGGQIRLPGVDARLQVVKTGRLFAVMDLETKNIVLDRLASVKDAVTAVISVLAEKLALEAKMKSMKVKAADKPKEAVDSDVTTTTAPTKPKEPKPPLAGPSSKAKPLPTAGPSAEPKPTGKVGNDVSEAVGDNSVAPTANPAKPAEPEVQTAHPAKSGSAVLPIAGPAAEPRPSTAKIGSSEAETSTTGVGVKAFCGFPLTVLRQIQAALTTSAKAPEGYEDIVQSLKKEVEKHPTKYTKGKGAPFAIAWAMRKKGIKPKAAQVIDLEAKSSEDKPEVALAPEPKIVKPATSGTPSLPIPGAEGGPDLKASAFDKLDEIDLGGGYMAKKAKKTGKSEGKTESRIVVTKADKEVGNYPDAFGDDSPAIIKFFRELLDIKEADDKAANPPKSETKDGPSVKDKPKALPAEIVKPKKNEDKGIVDEKELASLGANKEVLENRIEAVQQILLAYREKGYLVAEQDDVDQILLANQGKLTLEAAVNSAVQRAAERRQVELLALSDAELLTLKASLPYLKVKPMSVQASKTEGLTPLNILSVDSSKAEGLNLGAAFTTHFGRLG